MKLKYFKNASRTLVASQLGMSEKFKAKGPDSEEAKLEKLEIEFRYTGEGNEIKGIALDQIVIPELIRNSKMAEAMQSLLPSIKAHKYGGALLVGESNVEEIRKILKDDL